MFTNLELQFQSHGHILILKTISMTTWNMMHWLLECIVHQRVAEWERVIKILVSAVIIKMCSREPQVSLELYPRNFQGEERR